MEENAHDPIDPVGYLVAPLVPPTLNIAFVPVFAALSAHPGHLGESIGWMVVAWFGLEAICLATISPCLWLFRHFVVRLNISTRLAITASIALSGLASYIAFGTPVVAHAIPLSWLAAAISSAFAFIAYQSRDRRSLGLKPSAAEHNDVNHEDT